MITAQYTQDFSPDDFWAGPTGSWQLIGPDLAGVCQFRYQSAAGYVCVEGTGFLVSLAGMPLLGAYTTVTVYADAAYTQTIAMLNSDTDLSFPDYFAHTASVVFAGADEVHGSADGLTLYGFGGNDTIYGEMGSDTLVGGDGDDTFVVDDAGDTVSELGGEGTDSVVTSLTHALAANVENLTLTGTSAINGTGNALDNTIIGNAVSNVLDGGVGADTMEGGAGDDTYMVDDLADAVIESADAGDDTIVSTISLSLAGFAGVERLTLSGSAALDATGNDLDNVLTGNAQINHLSGGGGNDTIDGLSGADVMTGGSGDDTYFVDDAGDAVTELPDEGNDTVYATVNYTLTANVENLILAGLADISATGNDLANTILGNAGANVLDGSAGADSLNGGAGDDSYVIDNAGDIVFEAAGAGTDTIYSSLTFSLAALAAVERLTLTGSAAIDATGNDLDNVLVGNDAINHLFGGSGNDTLDGGAAADTLEGGSGNDIYWIESPGDTVVEAANEGVDTIVSSMTCTLAASVENLTLTGTANLTGSGNDLENTIVGNSGDNTVDGGLGRDTMRGGAGNDTYAVGGTNEVVVELVDEGTDTVRSSATYFLPDYVERLTLTGTSVIHGVGNGLNNVIAGNGANNIVNGGAGADVMLAGQGNDIYFVDTAADVVFERPDEGNDTVRSNVTYVLTANVENLTLSGAAAIDAFGNTGANSLLGNSAANILTGGHGRDVLTGLGGKDTFDYNALKDSGRSPVDRDVITDFTHLSDRIDLSTIDANAKLALDQAFTFLAQRGAAFTGVAGQLRYWANDTNTFVEVDTNADKVADMQIQLMGNKVLSAEDFVL